jgi:hypothetical protein
MRGRLAALAVAILIGVASVPAAAQWLNHPTAGIPRLPDGNPDFFAPAPRLPDGRPDISGLWLPNDPYVVNAKGGANPPGEVPFQPWAEKVYKERFDNFGIDDPSAYCIPGGVPRVNLIPYPFRIINAPGRVVILYEIYYLWREIFTDGRALPLDPNPTWMGYSVGRWEEDTFVVRSSGFNGKAWLDTEGRPTTDALQVIERFRRTDFGHMDLEIIVTDPKAYTRPWTIRVPLSFYADTEMLEYACAENNKYPLFRPQRQ